LNNPPEENPPESILEPHAVGSSRKKAARPAQRELDQGSFKDFIAQYPSRPDQQRSDPRARALYVKVIKSGVATHEELLRGACRYAAERASEDATFNLGAFRWLREERWRDAPDRPGHTPRPKQPRTQTERAMEAMLHRSGYFEET
jgi:hypothetical protein